jgi:hypothetical protein
MRPSRVSLGVIAATVLASAILVPSLGVRAQGFTKIEYARVTSFVVHWPTSANSVQSRAGYRACVAGVSAWTCRDFQPTESSAEALRIALATLGNEGWDLVSAVNEEPTTSSMTYLFKRQSR